MPGKQRPEHPCTARDEHRARGIERPGHREYQLANVAGTAQESIRVRCLSDVPRTPRKRPQFARLEEFHQLAEHLAQEFRSDVLEEIEGSILNAGMLRRHCAWASDVRFAQLDEPPPAGQEPQRRIDEFLLQAIEHHVHTRMVGYRRELLLEFQRARVRNVIVVESHAAQDVPFAGAGRRIHIEAPVLGQLHRSHADTAGGGVHQYPLACADARSMRQRVVRGEKHGWHGRRLPVGPP